MGLNEKRRQKSLMKKKQKDKQRKKTSKKGFFSGLAGDFYKTVLIKRAKEAPVFECLINPDWQESGLARILLSRRQSNGNLIIGTYLVDVLCLGLKNTFCNADISQDEYEYKLKAGMYRDKLPINCHPRLAHRIIYGGIEYAKALGFSPQKDFAMSRHVLDEPSEVDLTIPVEFGRGGKPVYIAGPEDDVERIMRQLGKKAGEGSFNFVTLA
jgi:hypothetical protein